MATIEELKSVIGKKGGIARTNNFRVLFTPPQTTLFNIDTDQLLGSLIGGGSGEFNPKNLFNDPRDLSLLCQSANIPGAQIQTLEHAHGKQSVKAANTFIHEPVNLKFILTNDYYIKRLFDNWIHLEVDINNHTVGYKKDYSCDMVIQQLNPQGKVVYGVKLLKAFPTTVTSIDLDSSNENAMGELSVTIDYDSYVPEGSVSSSLSGAGAVLDILNN